VAAPKVLEGPFVKKGLLEHERVEAWKTEAPRQWWAFSQLDHEDELRDRVLAAVLGGRGDDEAIDELIRFAEALEAHRRASKAGTVKAPPAVGERRSFPITVSRMTRMRSPSSGLFFRVAFACSDGWGGHFDTINPGVVEKISKLRNRAKPLTLVGEVSRRPYEFYVELHDSVRIV
jgi:hypothetical protein